MHARWLVPAVLALLVAASTVSAQSGESLGVTPPEHEIENAIQGESYRRQVTVQNEFDSNTTVTLNTSGEVGNWTTTEPTSGFVVPPRTHAPIDLTIAVPSDAVNGTYDGKLHLTAEPKDQPDGSGAAIRYSVAVLLEVQVGGEPVHNVSFTGGQGSDVEAGSPPDVEATVVNRGNVREMVEACAVVLPFDGGDPVAGTRVSERVLPGERATLDFSFETTLPLGQYRVQILPGCEDGTEPVDLGSDATFKVVPPGTLGKDGMLRFIEHAPGVDPGRPVEVAGVFENVGEVDIARASFTCRVFKDGELVDVIETEPRVVPIGEQAKLTGFFTPEEPGRYVLRGAVSYDGFQTEERESFLTVQGESASGSPAGWIGTIAPYLLVALIVGGVLVFLWRRRGSESASDDETAPASGGVAHDELETADVEQLDR